ncbi:DUF4360 domain-containing protein [Nostoc sp. CHAB 5784]|uniref:DUF4360 domain-containing protein n=1 Tax=Nostoc mirabile TaxID=2907820 RepID=UPI001E2A52B1|nr:DUF4360 domain-containing protein [Nostoc mirabile]MCC5663462.1 DUF4360 domain-containing protein [Nostoc mirabile CHAB5784]
MKVLTALISSLTLLSLNVVGLSEVQAQTVQPQTQGFQFESVPVTVFGNGCPSASAQTSLVGNTLSVTFPRFQAVAVSPRVVAQSCNLRIGLNVPRGYRVQPINLRYFGFANVPQGGSAALRVRAVFQGRQVPISSNDPNANFPAGFSGGWLKDVTITPDTIDACANPVNSVFGINTTLIARATNVAAGQRTVIRLNGSYRIRFNVTPC